MKRLDLPEAPSQGNAPETGSIYFIGTATVLIRLGPFTLLTDPNFLHAGDHVHLGYGLFARRLTNPATELERLPPFDLVLLSHLHGDHFDRIAQSRLDHGVPIATTPHAARWLHRKGFRSTIPLNTWESLDVQKGDGQRIRITSMPGKHGPKIVSRLLPPVMGSLIDYEKRSPEGSVLYRFRLYISGDTLVIDDLREIPKKFPGINLGLFHLGGTRILGVLVTMDATQGIEAIRMIHPELAIPIHYNDYTVFKSSLDDFRRAVEQAGVDKYVAYLAHGETYVFDLPATKAEDQRARRRAG